LRGMGRCPTLSSLTLVFYVCGFVFDSTASATLRMSSIDFESTPDGGGAFWTANLQPSSSIWQHVTAELVRAFVVPCTFQPGCAYPEVSDNCTIQISGLNGIGMTTPTSNDFGFTNGTATSDVLANALGIPPQDRAWGGNEGPLAWRAAAVDAQKTNAFTYAFAGTTPLKVTFPTKPSYSTTTKTLSWPGLPSLVFRGVPGLTVAITDAKGNTLQTLSVNLPANAGVPAPNPSGEYSLNDSGSAVQPSYYMTLKNRVLATQSTRPFLIQPGDTSRSMEAAADLRVIAGLANVPSTFFTNHPAYGKPVLHADNLHFADGTTVEGATGYTTIERSATYAAATNMLTWTDWTTSAATNYGWPTSPRNDCLTTLAASSGVTMSPIQNLYGDWDTGPGFAPDGAQINLPDSGTTNAPASAYFSLTGGCVGAPTQRTPNALVSSPVIFGSLPAGINPAAPAQSEPWRTLLFCPYPAANTSSVPYALHPGSATPPDHLILDNFWMPVVEPYAISTCMATAGKINLNDQIAPFTYLHRNTALHALLSDLRIPAIPTQEANAYKSSGTALTGIWNAVDENATIAQIENKLTNNSGDAYLSESEICAVPLVPQGVVPSETSVTGAQSLLESFWNVTTAPPSGGLTGDNLRELPYAQLYGRLTTRSNSYTVHIRVQVLQKLRGDPNQNVWNEGVDLVQGDWRGSYEIERYLDPAASAPVAGTPLGPYKFRILSSRQFAP